VPESPSIARSQPTANSRRKAVDRTVIIAAALTAIGLAVMLATATRTLDAYATELLIGAAVTGAAIAILATLLLRGQVGQKLAVRRALENAEARVSSVVESAMDPIVSVDESQRIVQFNAAAERVFGWTHDAILGEPVGRLLPMRFRDAHHEHLERFGRTGITSRRMGEQTLLVALRSNGEEFPIEASISQHSENGAKLFTAILRDVTERVQAETALRSSKEELKELGAAAQKALEQEKSRVARELHDDLAQALTVMQMKVAWCQEQGAAHPQEMMAKLDRMQALLGSTIAATRRLAADLRPLILDDLGLVPAVEWLAENFTARYGVPCELAVSSPDLELPSTHATAAFRIVQESLANIAKHARASRVDIAIERGDAELTISVRDDGCGFSTDDPRKPDSFGLLGLRERASLLGGEVIIASAPGQGTSVDVRLPVAEEAR